MGAANLRDFSALEVIAALCGFLYCSWSRVVLYCLIIAVWFSSFLFGQNFGFYLTVEWRSFVLPGFGSFGHS